MKAKPYAKLAAWVWARERVTAADLSAKDKLPVRKAIKLLLAAVAAGALATEGGGPGEALYFVAKENPNGA